jgi:uncharacterized protein YbaR (Trm112 family)
MLVPCPACNEWTEVPESKQRSNVRCDACSHPFIIRGRKIILEKGKYWLCMLCGDYFPLPEGFPCLFSALP